MGHINYQILGIIWYACMVNLRFLNVVVVDDKYILYYIIFRLGSKILAFLMLRPNQKCQRI